MAVKADKLLDTNVPIIANRNQSRQASKACIEACVDVIEKVFKDEFRLVLDVDWIVIEEYQHKLYPDDQSGLGDQFLRWVLTNLYNPDRCVLVKIEKDGATFNEFPNSDIRLKNFDPSDRKWIAVAIVYHKKHGEIASIVQAADHKWRVYAAAFNDHHIEIEFICDSP